MAQSTNNSVQLQSQGLFPFALPPFDDNPGPTDLSWLNEKPAGSRGFISTRGEDFVDAAGKPIRFWGVNLNFSGVFPSKDQAPRIAGRIAKYGFNSVRLHHFEGYVSPNGLWKPAAVGSTRLKLPREIDPEQMDRMDYFVSQLIERGIYINFNLHVARKVQDQEGFQLANQLPEKDKGIAYFEPRVQQEAKNFARLILTHTNPYTQKAYKDDPAVCAVEVANENSVLALWHDGSLSKLPEPYSASLRHQWNEFLTQKYASNVSLRAAWTELDQALSRDNLLSEPIPAGGTPYPGGAPVNPTDPGAPTILNAPILLPEPPAVAPEFNADGTQVAPVQPVPVAPTIDPGIANGLRRFTLATTTGAVGRVDVDELGGATIDGFVQPGLTVQMQQVGTVTWAFQLNRDGLPMVDGQPYTLTFWARADGARQISANLWQDQRPFKFLGFSGNANLTSEWRPFTFTFRPIGLDGSKARLSLNLGNRLGTVQLSGFSLRQGGRISMPDETMVRGEVPLLEFKNTPILAARKDFARFLGDLESTNVTEMRRFLKEEIGVRAPIWHTQAQFGGWGGLLRELSSDVIDMHAYWKHPDFGGAGWNSSTWRVENLSMAASAGSDPLSAYALGRVQGKPFVVSEWNSGQPNDFGGESMPIMAAYAAAQGWAGVWVFDYHSAGDYGRDKIDGFFSIDSHPVKMTTSVLAALVFRRPSGEQIGDIPRESKRAVLNIPVEAAWSQSAEMGGQPTFAPYVRSWAKAGSSRGLSLESSTGVELSQGVFAVPSRADLSNNSQFSLAGGRLNWDVNTGLWTSNTRRSKLIAGFAGGREVRLGELRLWANRPRQFVSGGISSMDGADIGDSRRLLLVLAGRAENIGMGFNTDRSSVGANWGSGPVYVEGIDATVRLSTSLGYARVWALDAGGQRREIVPSTLRNGVLKFQTGPVWQTIWYEIEMS